MSDSVRPHRQPPTRLLCSWDSPGKNSGVGCHFLLQCMKMKSESEVTQSCLTLRDLMDCSLPGSSVHGIFQVRVLEWLAIAFSDLGLIILILCISLNRLSTNIYWTAEKVYILIFSFHLTLYSVFLLFHSLYENTYDFIVPIS